MGDDVAAVADRGAEQWLRSSRLWIAAVAALISLGALMSVAGLWIEHRTQAPAQTRLRTDLRPAQVETGALIKAFDDQETGLRGFLLTGDQDTLQPYVEGGDEVRRLLDSLAERLGDYPRAASTLEALTTDGLEWQRTIAEPQVAARTEGRLPEPLLTTYVEQGKQSFDVVRGDTAALAAEVDRLIGAELDTFDSAQTTARLLQRGALGVVLVGAFLVALLLWQMTSRPLRRLVDGVDAVAAGDYARPVPTGGPQEYAKLGRAVESMRKRLLARSDDFAETQREITVLEERERVARDLQGLTIQRLFALGLRLSSMASESGGSTRAQLNELVGETDGIIKELRNLIFRSEDSHDPPVIARSE